MENKAVTKSGDLNVNLALVCCLDLPQVIVI